jgi:hypothetical protein
MDFCAFPRYRPSERPSMHCRSPNERVGASFFSTLVLIALFSPRHNVLETLDDAILLPILRFQRSVARSLDHCDGEAGRSSRFDLCKWEMSITLFESTHARPS